MEDENFSVCSDFSLFKRQLQENRSVFCGNIFLSTKTAFYRLSWCLPRIVCVCRSAALFFRWGNHESLFGDALAWPLKLISVLEIYSNIPKFLVNGNVHLASSLSISRAVPTCRKYDDTIQIQLNKANNDYQKVSRRVVQNSGLLVHAKEIDLAVH